MSAGTTSRVSDGLTRLALVEREVEEDFEAARFLGGISYNIKCKINDDKTTT